MKKSVKVWMTIATIVVGVIYTPAWLLAIVLRFIARFLLGISYAGLLKFRVSKDIFKSLFYWDDYRL